MICLQQTSLKYEEINLHADISGWPFILYLMYGMKRVSTLHSLAFVRKRYT